MPSDLSRERPPVRFPYVRVEKAGAVIIWIMALGCAATALCLVLSIVPAARPLAGPVAVIAALGLLGLIADYVRFEQRLEIDAKYVRYRRTSVAGSTEWQEPLTAYQGIALGVAVKGSPSTGFRTSGTHWSRRHPDHAVRLIHRVPDRSVTLWEFDETDFREATDRKVRELSELLGMPVLPRQENGSQPER